MKVAVIGAGIMGSGIAQLAAMSGHDVSLRDVDAGALETAAASVESSLARFVKSEKLTERDVEESLSRIVFTTDLDGVPSADVVVEAVPEILELKRRVWRELVDTASTEALLATNSSQLGITVIASGWGDAADRFIGMHFFNPPVVMNLVELVVGLETSDETIQLARDFAESMSREVVVCRRDTPGFITTRAYAALRLECLRILEEGVATAEEIDKALRLGFNFPMGPFELADYNGLDSYLYALESLEEAYGDRFRPTVTLRNMVAAGLLGRKTGRGFYDYADPET